MYIILVNGCFVLATVVLGVLGKQSFLSEPENAIVNPKENVMLTCKVNNIEGSCLWLIGPTIIGAIDNKYLYKSRPSDGDCSVQILNANIMEDDGSWQCQVTAARSGESTIVSRKANLTVREKPVTPYLEDNTQKIENGEKFSVRAGEMTTIRCISRKGNPPAILKWFIDNVDVTKMSTQTNSTDLDNPKTYQATSVLRYTYNKEHNMRTLKCSALHEMYPEKSLPVMVTLDVMYKPEISIQNKPENDIVEGTPLEVHCIADANPKANVMWKKAGNSAIYEVGEKLRFDSVKRTDSGIYSCSAKNAVGSSGSLEFQIDVKYPPVIVSMIPTSSQTVVLGDATNLTCKAEGNPPPQYIWIQQWNSNPPLFRDRGHKPTLFVKNTTYDYQGRYVCKVVNRINGDEIQKQSHEIELDIKGPPQVLPSSAKTKSKVIIEEEENAILTVFFCSDPAPVNSYWEWGSLKLNTGAVRGRFKAEGLLKDQSHGDCFEARMNIEKTTGSDARRYSFNIENKQGSAVFPVTLEVRKPVAVSMVIAIVVACIVLLFIVIIIVVYTFKAQKLCFKHSGTHNFKTDSDSEIGAGNTDTARTTASGAIPPDAVYTTPTMATTNNSNGSSHENGHYENVPKATEKEDRRNKDGLVYADLDLKPFDRRTGQGSSGRLRGSGGKSSVGRPVERDQIEYAEIQFQPKATEKADL